MSMALTARTLGDLARLTTDLAAPEHQPVRLDGGRPIAGIFTAAERRGRWVVPATMTCTAVFGEVVLDLREALLQDRHVVINVYAVCGRVRLIVPAGVEVVMNGSQLLGRQRGATARRVPTSSEIPVVEIRGYLAASEVLVRTPPRPRRWRQWLPGASRPSLPGSDRPR
jgi:Cell wall-active antibiotics response 4TMS YvqF